MTVPRMTVSKLPQANAESIEAGNIAHSRQWINWLPLVLLLASSLRRPQCSTDLGIHVDSGAWYLHGSQVGDMVARTDAPSMALSRIPFCLARNGCRIFLGLEQAHPSSPARGLVLGDIGDRLGS